MVREAYLEGPDGRRIVDMRDSNLHLLNYSTGFRGEVTREELDEHLHSRADMPDVIPYVTSYYKPRWGFCLPHRVREALPAGTYRVMIDADHIDGSMSLGEAVLKGETAEEVLIASDICHPSLGNDELSGPLALAFLYRRIAVLAEAETDLSFRAASGNHRQHRLSVAARKTSRRALRGRLRHVQYRRRRAIPLQALAPRQ